MAIPANISIYFNNKKIIHFLKNNYINIHIVNYYNEHNFSNSILF